MDQSLKMVRGDEKTEVDLALVEEALRWIFKRLLAHTEHFRPMATGGFSTSGRGAVVVQIQFDDLMARKGDKLQVAFIPDKLLHDFHNDLLSEYVSKYEAMQNEFVLTVVSRKDVQSFISSDIIQ
jgi:hypothetical protein